MNSVGQKGKREHPSMPMKDEKKKKKVQFSEPPVQAEPAESIQECIPSLRPAEFPTNAFSVKPHRIEFPFGESQGIKTEIYYKIDKEKGVKYAINLLTIYRWYTDKETNELRESRFTIKLTDFNTFTAIVNQFQQELVYDFSKPVPSGGYPLEEGDYDV